MAWWRGRLRRTATDRSLVRPTARAKADIESPGEHNRFPYGPAIAVGCVLAVLDVKEEPMTRVRIFTVFLIAILAGGGLAYGTYDYLQNVPVKTVTVPTRQVVVANADLSLGRQLRREDLVDDRLAARRRAGRRVRGSRGDRRSRPDRLGRAERADPSRPSWRRRKPAPACRR